MLINRRYLQFFVNASIVVFVLYLVAMFVLTVQRDVRDRMAEASVGEPTDPSSVLSLRSKISGRQLTGRVDAGDFRVHAAVPDEPMRPCCARPSDVSRRIRVTHADGS